MPSTLPSRNGNTDADILKQYGGLNIGYAVELLEQGTATQPSAPASTRKVAISGKNGAGRPGRKPADPEFHRLSSYVTAIRDYGYRIARLDPLGFSDREESLLDPVTHRVAPSFMDAPASDLLELLGEDYPVGFGSTTGELIDQLRDTYCQTTGYEFAHVRSLEERRWLHRQVETGAHRIFLSDDQRRDLLGLLTRAESFEHFLHRAYPAQRWYSLEGLESLIVLLDQLVLQSAHTEVRNIVIGMAHRGRLNVLAHVFGKPYRDIITEFSDGHFTQLATLEAQGWMTDVKYHQGARWERDVDGDGLADVRLRLLPNPSHLEMVDPVVVGAVRAMQDSGDPDNPFAEAMGVIVHGDAAYAGQGIVAETFNLARLAGYGTGGSIHIIANNKLGFTTEPKDAHSTEHASDIARGFDIPVVHVNADDVPACVAVAKLAVSYRERFHKDFLIDLVGYRRFGHNENDEPGFTQPLMYKRIAGHATVRAIWAAETVAAGLVSKEEADRQSARAVEALLEIKAGVDAENDGGSRPDVAPDLALSRTVVHGLEYADSAVPESDLHRINKTLTTVPVGFTPHPTVARLLKKRAAALNGKAAVDWGHAEALAIGSILADGHPVRLSGQDVGRGTFSHRHAVLFDNLTGKPWTPLAEIDGAAFHAYNSPLTEAAVIGFEHGYSVSRPASLVIWEAQFGDFVNNAQSMVDELVVSAEAKWGQHSGLVLLLPHGYEGQGPNHSHAHIERFLALAAKDNMRIAYPTTAGQFFHLLRSQAAMLKDEPSPLIVMTGKSLLRHPLAAATLSDLASGGFRPVISHRRDGVKPGSVKRLVLCTGKVFIDMTSHPDFKKADDVAVIRIEELYPFPGKDLKSELSRLPDVEKFIWLQEEPQNRGAWAFVAPRLRRMLPEGRTLEYVGRPGTPSPAEGSNWLHKLQQSHLIKVSLGVEEMVSAVF